MLLRLFAASILLCFTPFALAQDVAFSTGLAAPTGPFAEDGVGLFGVGGAATGYVLGLDVAVPFYGPLAALGSVSFSANRLSNVPSAFTGSNAETRLETGSYSNIPITAGLGLRVPFSSAFEAEGFVQGGINFTRRPEIEIIQTNTSFSVTDPAQGEITAALILGARLTYAGLVVISPRYLRLGEAPFTTPNLVPPPSGFGEQPISLLQLLVGVRLP